MYSIGEKVVHRVFKLNGQVTKVDKKTVSILFNNGYFRVFQLESSFMYLKRIS
ncbi:hypothetical protein GCM10009001_24270 [Virgibacillus siamensis]|uniref:DUF2187 domain-containing protein n=1 Tax=Virgibacillus siamensis TaxID=480071 RepID=A0ABN1G8G6_9BACI